MHSGPFGCLTKLGRKRAELVQKFVPRSRVGILRNEDTLSNPLDPKLTFWCVLYHLGAFGTIWLPHETRCKTGRTSAKVRATKSRRNFHNERTRSSPFDSKLMFWRVSYHLGPFGCITKLGTKRAELGQKFVPQSRVGMVLNERTRSTHWTLNSCLGVFRCN